ncbi:MAG: DUF2264 domain-containing protein [Candidatus Symbiothrix sp.]|jgi:rhamnogalacturonyl hydrolase YesR|nr:DUF2264 domain-containing protein [Candidatus Symbiothrix sp.]
MKRIFLIGFAVVGCWAAQAGVADDNILSAIQKVNDRWQTTHPQPDGNAFWHYAAYHTGNMAAYFATGNEAYLNYSTAWAEKNEWKGAKSNDKSTWKYSYGETDEYVLFGDWQICFQTYIDLYNLQPDEKKIARAIEVMEYEMSTPNSDYWWWADGLYMVMPIMTKLYQVTGKAIYLQKLYEYFSYSKNLMYDAEAGLFYRDAKYIYPKHKTNQGLKDFWSRGNGWVFAALAKVLQDLPVNDIHREEYIQIYRSMAAALKNSQQPEGHWTRSLLDVEQASGYETSGTAFFTYGFLWGMNAGILDKDVYSSVVNKSWNYLTKTALQPDGTVGYVQPIGERADQHKNVDAQTTADFGVGAFLLAAAEMLHYTRSNDRAYWADLAYRIAAPVLSNMSKGELKKNMQVEVSPTWDGRSKDVTYMECFGRLMSGIAPWLSLPDDNTDEGQQRKQLREWALKSYAHAVNPQSPDYLLWRNEGQPLVDAAFIASSFLRAPEQLWQPLDEQTKNRYISEFQQLRRIDPPNTNWLLFSAIIETFLMTADAQYDMYRIHSAIRKIDGWYVGDGWYSDGEHFAFDYYNSYVIQPMYVQVLQVLTDRKIHLRDKSLESVAKNLEDAKKRMQRYGMILERLISPEASFPTFGRSMTYRLGVFQPLSLLAWKEQLPKELPEGQVRYALTSVMKRMFSQEGNFNEKGFLQLGFAGHQPDVADWYTNNGSMYLTSEVFLPLGLPANHSFWTASPLDWTGKKAWNGKSFPKDHSIR